MVVLALQEQALLPQLMYRCGEQAAAMVGGPVEVEGEHTLELPLSL
jgi:hypothetical protein